MAAIEAAAAAEQKAIGQNNNIIPKFASGKSNG